jgi:hypothetical protein
MEEINKRCISRKYFSEENIKIILTKEQFEVNCYKVGGEDE